MPGAFGAYVDDLDLAGGVDDLVMRQLVDALGQHRILFFRGQRPAHDDYVGFGRRWGDPIEYFSPGDRDRRFPELIRIRNSPRTPTRLRDGAMHWHADSSYEPVPAAVTMLLAEEAPASGNETLFADCVAAYQALSPEMKERIEGLQVLHDPRGGKVALDGERRGESGATDLPVVSQPLVATHPVTGRRSLYGFSGTASGIVGLHEDKAVALLIEIKRHVLRPEFRQRATAAAGTILMWDNLAVIHCATPTEYSDEEGKRRLLYRISTRGVPAAVRSGPPAGP
jgi:taurine dioxygenase